MPSPTGLVALLARLLALRNSDKHAAQAKEPNIERASPFYAARTDIPKAILLAAMPVFKLLGEQGLERCRMPIRSLSWAHMCSCHSPTEWPGQG